MRRLRVTGFGTFEVVWFGQLISYIGSGLTNFALGVWVYQRTASVTQFALIAFFAGLPGLLAAPFAGALVDRWDRRLGGGSLHGGQRGAGEERRRQRRRRGMHGRCPIS